MLYVRQFLGDRGFHFIPINDSNVFVYCTCCNRFVQIPEPAGYIYEAGACSESIESHYLCDECMEKHYEYEEEAAKLLYGNDQNSPITPQSEVDITEML